MDCMSAGDSGGVPKRRTTDFCGVGGKGGGRATFPSRDSAVTLQANEPGERGCWQPSASVDVCLTQSGAVSARKLGSPVDASSENGNSTTVLGGGRTVT